MRRSLTSISVLNLSQDLPATVQPGLSPLLYTNPRLSWDALPKETGVQLEVLTDYDMHLSMAFQRYAKASNTKAAGYDPSKPTTHIVYLDANNLSGWAMTQPPQTGTFEWVEN